jgi:hypothetical protein
VWCTDKIEAFSRSLSLSFASHFVSFSLLTRVQSLVSCGSRRNIPFVLYPRNCAIGAGVEDRTKPRSQQSRTYTWSLVPWVFVLFWARPALRERINGRDIVEEGRISKKEPTAMATMAIIVWFGFLRHAYLP